jgi:phosphate ABC transporter phosphate-binding protein
LSGITPWRTVIDVREVREPKENPERIWVEGVGERMTASSEDMERLQQRPGGFKRIWIVVAAVAVVVALVGVAVFAGWFSPKPKISILGAGATFPCPLITKWTSDYANLSLSYAGKPSQVVVSYNCVGSGAGITAITKKTVDFAGSDAPLKASERAAAPGLLHIPETVGAVTLAYNVQAVDSGLKLTGETVAEIFRGKVQFWDDANISRDNTGVSLPHRSIQTVHRQDSSGTTFVFTSYLHLADQWWNTSLVGKSISWPATSPTAIEGLGNSGVAGKIQTTPDSIGYVELAYTVQNNMKVAQLKNHDGQWVAPSLATTAAAAASLTAPPSPAGDWNNVSILNASGANSYPIASFTYLLVYNELNALGPTMDQVKAQALVDFLWWAIHPGQDRSEALVYPKLPAPIVTLDEGAIRSITFNGQTLNPT